MLVAHFMGELRAVLVALARDDMVMGVAELEVACKPSAGSEGQ